MLNNGAGVGDKVFGMSRKLVHRQLKFDSGVTRKSRFILIARDPYTRLYSAFVDKMLLPPEPIKSGFEGVTCGNEQTFEKFLQEISKSAYKGKTLNMHWAPIISLCDPCNVSPFALVKQESFTTDVEYVLKEIGIAADELEVIRDALHDHRVEATVPGIVHTIMSMKLICKKQMDVANDIWLSLQIQGYIKDDIPFPYEFINSKENANQDYLTDLILNTIKENPLTTEESKVQRHRYLVNAYKSINGKTLEDIQNIYKQDFIIFDYSFEPPSNKVSNKERI